MAYGDYDGPNKPNKGHEDGACNRTLCQAEPAIWWNHGSHSWYCADCARDIGGDRAIAAMPIAVEPEFATPLRTACFAIMGVTVFACLFGSLLS
jgi:hypothetical protein